MQSGQWHHDPPGMRGHSQKHTCYQQAKADEDNSGEAQQREENASHGCGFFMHAMLPQRYT